MISTKTAEKLEDVLIKWMEGIFDEFFEGAEVYEASVEALDNLFDKLKAVPGNNSFMDSVRLMAKRIRTRAETLS